MKDYAILVGIGSYPEDAELDPLKGPHNDLKRIQEWLVLGKEAGGGGLQPDDIITLTDNCDYELNANYDDIINAILSVKRAVVARTPDAANKPRPLAGRLYLYFAGHGIFPPAVQPADRMEAGFLPEDWRPDLAGKYIPVYQLSLMLNQEGYFEEIVVVSDACRSKLLQQISPQNLAITHDPDPLGGESRLLLCFAAKHEEYAKEQEIDGRFLGVFSKSLYDALVGAPRNQDGNVTYVELRQFIISRMATLLGPNDFQNPRIEVFAMGDQISLASGQLPSLTMSFKFTNGGYDDDIVLRDGDYNELVRFPAGSVDAQTIVHPAGQYTLEGPGDTVRDIYNYELEGLEVEL